MLIARIHEKRIFEGFIVGKEKIHESILQFPDDTLIFWKYDDGMLNNLKKTIEIFEWCSGQKVEWENFALCGVNVEEERLLSTAIRLNCNVKLSTFLSCILVFHKVVILRKSLFES